MRLPSVLYLLPLIAPPPQSPPPARNAESFAGLLSPAPVAPGPPQLTSDAVLTPLPARAVSSASAFDISVLPGSAVSSALNSPNGVTPGTLHSRDATPDPLGVCQGLIEDSDIAGLGVRITFYMTSIFAVINACIPGSDGKGSSWVNLFTFIALMLSAIVQAANHSISLYNAMIVLYLGYLSQACAVIVFSLSQKEKGTIASIYKTWAFSQPYLFWYGFAVYVWVHARSFGSQPECNAATKLIVFGREHLATGSGRVVSLVFIHVQFFVVTLLAVPIGCLVGCVGGVIEMIAHGVSIASPPDTLSIEISPKTIAIENDMITALSFTVIWIYIVVTIEQTIQRNPVIRNGPRFPITFGQIFPVITIGACLVSIYNDLREARKKAREEAQEKAQAEAREKAREKALEDARRKGRQEGRQESRRKPRISRGTDTHDLEASNKADV